MKLGIIISVVILIFFGAVGYMGFRGFPEPPTMATSPDKLAVQTLAADLPVVFESPNRGHEATNYYEQALRYYADHRIELSTEPPGATAADEIGALLVKAMRCTEVQEGFLDTHIPVKPGGKPDFEDALEVMPWAVVWRAGLLYEAGQTELAMDYLLAVWVFGERVMRHNVRLYNRWQGLEIVMTATETLLSWQHNREGSESGLTEAAADAATQWFNAAQAVDKVWGAKYELLAMSKPQVGDLINIARYDQDVSFRIEAVLRLGMAKFNPGSRGNRRAIHETIEAAQSEDHPVLAEAGRTSGALTRDEFHRIY